MGIRTLHLVDGAKITINDAQAESLLSEDSGDYKESMTGDIWQRRPVTINPFEHHPVKTKEFADWWHRRQS